MGRRPDRVSAAGPCVVGNLTPRASRGRDDRRTTCVAPPHRSIPACSASCLLAGDRSRGRPRLLLRVRPEDLRYDNAVALLAGLENPSDETHAGLLAALHQRLRAPELRGLKKIMLA